MDDRSSSRQLKLSTVVTLAASRGGYLTHAQLLALGISKSSIHRLTKRGYLTREYPGVYAVGPPPTDPVSRCKGALLACGERSAVGLDSAGAYWQMRRRWPATPELWVASDHRPAGLTVHHTSTLLRTEVWEREPNLHITSPARTLMDLALRVHDDDHLTWMVSNALVRRIVNLGQIGTVLAAHPHHRGARRLAGILALMPAEPFRSPWEVEWPPFAALHDLGGYEMNPVLGGIRVDILYPGRLVVWLDGWTTHQLKPTFEQDRADANELLAELGIPNLRITHDQFHQTPERAASWVRRARGLG